MSAPSTGDPSPTAADPAGSPPTVETVRGPVPVDRLGPTLMHEHLFVLSTEFQQNLPSTYREDELVADAVSQLDEVARYGVETFVDPTALGQGRYIPRVQRIAEQTPLNIIVATGVYTFHDEPNFFFFRGPGKLFEETEPMTEWFVRDIREGIADTGVKAGLLKCASEEQELSAGVDRVLRATAQAHRETGVPITTHSNAFVQNGLLQQKVLAEEGVDLRRVVIGHSGDTDDLDYLKRLMDSGSFIGMDRFGMDMITPHERRVQIVADLVDQGYAGQIVLSHDCPCHIDFFTEEQRRKHMPTWSYVHIHQRVLPALRDRGVSDEAIHTMFVDNPRRYFAANTPY